MNKFHAKKSHASEWSTELDDLIRGACGGFLFGIPLLYTMEVWWIGSYATPPQMLMALITDFILAFLLTRTAGFRKVKDIQLIGAAMDAVEAIALGLICTTIILILLQEITFDVPLDEALGKILFESVPFTLGAALATQLLKDQPDDEENQTRKNGSQDDESGINATLADIGGTLIGALFVAFNIAPTDEVAMLAAAVSGGWLFAIMIASLVISYLVVFEAGFTKQGKRIRQQGLFQRPSGETVMSYLVSLVAAAFMLLFFQQLTFSDPWTVWLEHSLLLGLPATVGGAAGRLAV